MNMQVATGVRAETGEAFIHDLYQTVIGAGENSLKALEELSNIAFGGHEQARKLINEIDRKVKAHELILPNINKPIKA